MVRGSARLWIEHATMRELGRMKEVRIVFVLQVVDRDHGRNRTHAWFEVGERTEPQVEPLATDQIAQVLGTGTLPRAPRDGLDHGMRHRAEQASQSGRL